MMKLSKRMILKPAVAALLFDIMALAAIMIKIYVTDSVLPSVQEVLFSSPLCYFWILWTALVFYCSYGVMKEYMILKYYMHSDYPAFEENEIVKYARWEFIYLYSKKLLLLFAGLPLVYLISKTDDDSGFSAGIFVILCIPFVIDLSVYLYLKRNR